MSKVISLFPTRIALLIWTMTNMVMGGEFVGREMVRGSRIQARVTFFNQWAIQNEGKDVLKPLAGQRLGVSTALKSKVDFFNTFMNEGNQDKRGEFTMEDRQGNAFDLLKAYIRRHKNTLLTNELLEDYVQGLLAAFKEGENERTIRKAVYKELDLWVSMLSGTKVWGRGPFDVNMGAIIGKMGCDDLCDCQTQESVILRAYHKGYVKLAPVEIRKLQQYRQFRKLVLDFYNSYPEQKTCESGDHWIQKALAAN